ncbi:MAG: GNAT family N-acetyltransferase [Dactylosporangium sp.]|nr:GNAT family N-acetyltransferase [Dactylosporangium sp.]NNJ62678.1 GNAT family N-acetyltransferase [Dactylosporangium sp.]
MRTPVDVTRLSDEHAGELLTLQRAAYVTEAQRYHDPNLPPLLQTLDELVAELRLPAVTALGARHGHRLVGAVRLRADGPVVHLGRLVVAPDRQGLGIGSVLLAECERAIAPETTEIQLFTGGRSDANIRLYERLGYRRQRDEPAGMYTIVHLTKVLAAAR